MRHRINKSKLSLSKSKRRALMVSLSKAMITNGRITTTKDRAKNVRSMVERLVSLGKDGNLHAKRQAYRVLGDHRMVARLFNEVAPKFKSRTGGYTRIIRVQRRRGDNAQMCLFELTDRIEAIKTTLPESRKEEARLSEKAVKVKTSLKVNKQVQVKAEKELKPPIDKKTKSAPEDKKRDKKAEAKKIPSRQMLGGLRRFFKKERDSL